MNAGEDKGWAVKVQREQEDDEGKRVELYHDRFHKTDSVWLFYNAN